MIHKLTAEILFPSRFNITIRKGHLVHHIVDSTLIQNFVIVVIVLKSSLDCTIKIYLLMASLVICIEFLNPVGLIRMIGY